MTSLSDYLFNPYAIPPLAVALLSLVGSSLGLIRERTSKISIALFALGSFVSIWFFAFAWMYSARIPEAALWWAKAAYLGVPFIPSAIFSFTVTVLNTYRRDKRILWVGWIVSLVFSILAIRTNLLISEVYHYWWGYYSLYGVLGVPFAVFTVALMSLSLFLCLRELHKTPLHRTGKRQRLKIVAIAHLISGVACVDFLPKYHLAVYPFAFLGVLGIITLFVIATWRYQLVNLTPAFAAQKIIDTMAEALLVLDYEGMITRINHASLKLLGYKEEELIDQPIHKILTERPNGGRNGLGDGFAELISGDSIRNEERYYRGKDGRTIPVHFSSSVMHDRFGKIQGVVCVASDITESKRTMKELEKAKEAAEVASIAKSQFLAKMSHEIRTPMNGVFGMIQLLLEGGLNERQRKICNSALRSGEVLMGIVNDVLDLSKIEAGKLKLQRQGFDVRGITGEVMEMFSEPARHKGLEMTCVKDCQLPDALLGDSLRIRQILLNIIGKRRRVYRPGKDRLASEGRGRGGRSSAVAL